jgi:hypothetical protein
MPTDPPPTAQARWCDAYGTPIALSCWVEQVTEHSNQSPPSRLHQRGEVVGRGPDVLYVCFEGEGQPISVAPQLLRLLPGPPDRRWS